MTVDIMPPFAETISPEARRQYEAAFAAGPGPAMDDIEAMRRDAARRTKPIVERRAARYGTRIVHETIAGVPTVLVLPPDHNGDVTSGPLLMNFHGGGFLIDYSALSESIPIAALTGIPVRSVLYRLAPEHRFPAAVEDALAVYRHSLHGRDAGRLALFGTSAGAILTVQLLARLKADGLPMPASAGLFSVTADLANRGDCEALLPPLAPGRDVPTVLAEYRGNANALDPLVSPIFGDLTEFPPALLMTSTRDSLLSQTILLHNAFLEARVSAELRVFEGMLHAFWMTLESPETETAHTAQADFLSGSIM